MASPFCKSIKQARSPQSFITFQTDIHHEILPDHNSFGCRLVGNLRKRRASQEGQEASSNQESCLKHSIKLNKI